MATRKQTLRSKLKKAGFTNKEQIVMAKGYSLKDFRTLPYLRRIVQSRRLYINNLRMFRGYDDKKINKYIINQYKKSGWFKDGDIDVWAMIRYYRQKAIDEGEYPEKKGSHHGHGVSKGDVEGQKRRARKVTDEQKIKNLNAQIVYTENPETKQWLIELRDKLIKGK